MKNRLIAVIVPNHSVIRRNSVAYVDTSMTPITIPLFQLRNIPNIINKKSYAKP